MGAGWSCSYHGLQIILRKCSTLLFIHSVIPDLSTTATTSFFFTSPSPTHILTTTPKMLRRLSTRAPQRLLSASKPRSVAPLLAIRAISTTPVAKMSQLSTHATQPADAFQLLPESQKAGEAEDRLYEATVKEIEAWWASPRYQGIKRPYSAEDVATKRGTQKVQYPSSVMAQKLFNLIQERVAKGEPIHTSKSPTMLKKYTANSL